MKTQVALVHDGEHVGSQLTYGVDKVPLTGEWVQVFNNGTYQNFTVKHVLHKFVRGMGSEPQQRIILILEEIKEEV